MTVLELRFPTGRVHATPWGRHVNEGAVEWPPSPWRILRALIATWHLKAREDITEDALRKLIDALSSPPRFQLPSRATASHTRHYMPVIAGKNQKTTKIFDTFIHLPARESIRVVWDVKLSATERDALLVLAHRLGYFGRAESLVEATLLPESEPGVEANAHPQSDDQPMPDNHERVRLLAAMQPEAYVEWRTDHLAKLTPPAGAKKKRGKKNTGTEIPDDLFAALHADTATLQSAGWNLPPGARYVSYSRPENAFNPEPMRQRVTSQRRLTVARFEVVSAVAPRITQAVSIGNRIHDALCKFSEREGSPAAVFSGQDTAGNPLPGHRHAHILCEANGTRDTVTHVTVYADMGVDEVACLALRGLRKVWGHGGHDLHLVLHGIGQPGDFPDCQVLRESRIWRSLTPFVSTRHAKTHRDGRPKIDSSNGWQDGSAGHDLLRLLALHPRGYGATIRLLDERERPYAFAGQRLRSLQFQTVRHGGNGSRGHQSGAAFTIEFPEPRNGPFALGYGAHFGLGLFVPA